MQADRKDRATVSHEGAPGAARPVGGATTPVGSLRWFVALRPDAAAATQLGRLATTIARQGRGRPLVAADLHLTLAFIGERDAAFGDRLRMALAPLAQAAPTAPLVLDRLGRFGRPGRAGLAWAGPAVMPAWLAEAAATVRRLLCAMPCAFDERPLVPHLTLVRNLRDPAIAPAALATPVAPRGWQLAIGRNRAPGQVSRYAWMPVGGNGAGLRFLS